MSVPIAIAFTQLCRVDPLSSLLLLKNNICISSHPKCAAHSLHTHPGQLHGVLHIEGLTDLMAEMCVSKLSKRDPLLLLAVYRLIDSDHNLIAVKRPLPTQTGLLGLLSNLSPPGKCVRRITRGCREGVTDVRF